MSRYPLSWNTMCFQGLLLILECWPGLSYLSPGSPFLLTPWWKVCDFCAVEKEEKKKRRRKKETQNNEPWLTRGQLGMSFLWMFVSVSNSYKMSFPLGPGWGSHPFPHFMILHPWSPDGGIKHIYSAKINISLRHVFGVFVQNYWVLTLLQGCRKQRVYRWVRSLPPWNVWSNGEDRHWTNSSRWNGCYNTGVK